MSPILSSALVVLAWIGAGLVTLGYMKAKVAAFDSDLKELKEERKEFVRRDEFNARVGRVEGQIDRGLGLKGA